MLNRCNRNTIDGKEINITLEDALMSLESLRFMLGGAIKRVGTNNDIIVHHTAEVVCEADNSVPFPKDLDGKKFDGIEGPVPTARPGHPIRLINLSKGTRTQLVVETGTLALPGNKPIDFINPAMINNNGSHTQTTEAGDHIRIFWDEIVTTSTTLESAVEVTISPNTYPGTYRVVGDTFMRSQETGKDEPFQFVINQVKVASEVTLTLEAEGDPSTFSMTLNVLRATNEDGEQEMMKLIRYTVGAVEDSSAVSRENDHGSISGSI